MKFVPRYTASELDAISQGSVQSAEVIVPFIKNIFSPVSVLDVGCGLASWLKVWEQNGVGDIFGVDGGEVAADQLMISSDKFRAIDLRDRFDLGRRFGLVQSLEVGEHLPTECAADFVDSLTTHADVVLFSAAIPGQGGYLHLNERWQSYWAALFEQRGLQTFDIVRPLVWNNNRVRVWYKQNSLVFVQAARVAEFDGLQAFTGGVESQIDLVHPEMFSEKMSHPQNWASAASFPVRKLAVGLMKAIPAAIRRRFAST